MNPSFSAGHVYNKRALKHVMLHGFEYRKRPHIIKHYQ
jgi:hypothetical protein